MDAISFYQSMVPTNPYGSTVLCDNQTEQFIARLATRPTNAVATAMSVCINSLIRGGAWALLDGLYIFTAADQPTALTNWISGNYSPATNVNSVSFTANSYMQGNGTSSTIDSGFNPTTASSPHFQLNSACAFCYYGTFGGGNETGICDNSTPQLSQIYVGPASATAAGSRLNSLTSLAATGQTTAGSSLWSINRSSSTNMQLYKNGASVATSTTNTSIVIPNSDLFMVGGSTNEGFDNPIVYAAGFGGSLTSGQQSALYSAINIYVG